MDRTFKFFTTLIILTTFTMIGISIHDKSFMGVPEEQTTIVEETLEVTIVDKFTENGKYYAKVYCPRYEDIIEIDESDYICWGLGDTITVGVGFTYTL